MNSSPKAALINLGCRVNKYELDCVGEHLCRAGFELVPLKDECDVCIINTCTVTAESDRKSRQAIRRAVSLHPEAFVIAIGCSAQANAESLSKIEGLDRIFGSRNKLCAAEEAVEFIKNRKRGECKICTPSLEKMPFEKMSITRAERTRAYVKIEDGCENLCSYCAIPAARGSVCSKPENEVLLEVRALAANGYSEVVLTGIETASWGRDIKDASLISLIEKAANTKGIERIRLGSLYPSFPNEFFAGKAAHIPKLMPHFHLSLQSGSDKVLFEMGRRYTTDEVYENMSRLRSEICNMEFSCDLMVGFPGETDEDHKNTLEFLKKARFAHVHRFIYSKRPGTPAAQRQDSVPDDVKNARAKEVDELCAKIKSDIICSYIKNKTPLLVLCERDKDGWCFGHTENFFEVCFECREPMRGKLVPVVLTDHSPGGKITAKRI